jgi:hypothetical protein
MRHGVWRDALRRGAVGSGALAGGDADAARDKKGANFALEHIAGDWDRGIFRTQALIDWVTGWSQSWL